jgi:branched-subunit amino acid transport protein AzlD
VSFSDAYIFGGIGLELLCVLLLIRGPFTRYFPLFLYLVTILSVDSLGTWILQTEGLDSAGYSAIYWRSEVMVDLLLFFLVISMTARTLEGNPLRPKVIQMLTAVVAAVVVLPFLIFQSDISSGTWGQSTAQLLNFGAAVMVFVMWGALVISRQKDRQLQLVCVGLGLTVTAAALTLGVRKLTHKDSNLREISEVIYRMSQMAAPAIWCWAFRPVARPGKKQGGKPQDNNHDDHISVPPVPNSAS